MDTRFINSKALCIFQNLRAKLFDTPKSPNAIKPFYQEVFFARFVDRYFQQSSRHHNIIDLPVCHFELTMQDSVDRFSLFVDPRIFQGLAGMNRFTPRTGYLFNITRDNETLTFPGNFNPLFDPIGEVAQIGADISKRVTKISAVFPVISLKNGTQTLCLVGKLPIPGFTCLKTLHPLANLSW